MAATEYGGMVTIGSGNHHLTSQTEKIKTDASHFAIANAEGNIGEDDPRRTELVSSARLRFQSG